MVKTVAVIGAGRMGTYFCGQIPKEFEKIIIDRDEAKARELAQSVGGRYGSSYSLAAEADVVAMILPKPVIASAARELAPFVKEGAVVLNMATGAQVEPATVEAFPGVRFVDAQIIGHARSLMEGAPAFVVLGTEDAAVCEAARACMPGYTRVLMGDASLVGKINKIGSGEGIAAAVKVKKQLQEMQIPEDWIDIVIYTVCAGTMRSYVQKDLGEFAQELADRLENDETYH